MSNIYGKRSRISRLKNSLRTHTRWWLCIGMGALLVAGASTASAAILLTGRGTVTAPAYSGGTVLKVTGERISGFLTPGGAVDLSFTVHNTTPFPARIERVSLAGRPRNAKPSGCAVAVGGPVASPGGYPAQPGQDRVFVPAGGKVLFTVAGAFTLPESARGVCGFTVDILVNASQVSAPRSPAPDPTATQASPPAGPESQESPPADPPVATTPPALPEELPGDGGGQDPPDVP